MSDETKYIVNVNIIIVDSENALELAEYLQENSEKIARVALNDIIKEEAVSAAPAAAPEKKEENEDGWDTELEDLTLEGELMWRRMDETKKRAEEKMAVAVKTAEEAEEAELEAEEAEKNYKRNNEKLFEALEKKKQKKN